MKRPGLKELGLVAALAGVGVGGVATEKHFSEQAAQENQQKIEQNTFSFIETRFRSLEDDLKEAQAISNQKPEDIYETNEDRVISNYEALQHKLDDLQKSYFSPYSESAGSNLSFFNSEDQEVFAKHNPDVANKFKDHLLELFKSLLRDPKPDFATAIDALKKAKEILKTTKKPYSSEQQ